MAGSECVEYRALSLTQNQVDRKWPFRDVVNQAFEFEIQKQNNTSEIFEY